MLQANGFHHSALKIRSFKMVYDIVVVDAYVCPKNGPTTVGTEKDNYTTYHYGVTM